MNAARARPASPRAQPAAMIAGFKDPWEKPLRFVHNERMKKFGQSEKEARLLVAAWQGRDDEVQRVLASGKPGPRTEVLGMSTTEKKIRLSGKARRSETLVKTVAFAGNDLYRYGTPLHKAAQAGNLEIVKEFLSNTTGAKASQLLEEKNEVGNTALHHAAFNGRVQVVEAILEALSDVDVLVNKQLQRDEDKGVKKINASLVAIACRNMYLSTPLDKANEMHQKKVVAVIEGWPANLKLRNAAMKEIREIVDKYEKKPRELDTVLLRTKLNAADAMPKPHVKPEVMERARTLLHRAEDMK